jgi:hypothetical protein
MRILSIVAVLTTLLLVAACDDNEVTGVGAEDGSAVVSVFLTDAPGDVEAVWVDVVEIYLQGDGRVVLLDEPTGLVELTSLAGTSTPLVQGVEVESGSYGQLRFVIGGAVLETTDGRVYSKDGAEHPDGLETTGDLHCPSCSETGIKVLLRGEDLVLGGGATDYLLDFDVTQSFGRPAGQSGMWVMHPVIHGVRMVQMGSITGTVALATDEDGDPIVSIPECPAGDGRSLVDFVPTATAGSLVDDEGDPVIRTGFTDAEGAFQMLGLVPDTYTLGYMGAVEYEGATLEWTATVQPGTADVGEGDEVSGVVYTITGAACEVDEGG